MQKDLKPFFLTIKRQYFDAILAGTKTAEYRCFNTRNSSLFLQICQGKKPCPKQIIFQNGYDPTSPRMLCDVVKVILVHDPSLTTETAEPALETHEFQIWLANPKPLPTLAESRPEGEQPIATKKVRNKADS